MVPLDVSRPDSTRSDERNPGAPFQPSVRSRSWVPSPTRTRRPPPVTLCYGLWWATTPGVCRDRSQEFWSSSSIVSLANNPERDTSHPRRGLPPQFLFLGVFLSRDSPSGLYRLVRGSRVRDTSPYRTQIVTPGDARRGKTKDGPGPRRGQDPVVSVGSPVLYASFVFSPSVLR